ncbi:MAG: late competence development ComFB family protein [Desulfobacteraceae bacterium]|nr:late competence development ComFB family protein [Desulfobacteraceae bacterium]MCF8094631.1 late competence development ComFB family protein [Desulfobacteraceae bacterium]
MSGKKGSENKYQVAGADLSGIRNRNELRVLKMMERVLDEYPGVSRDVLNIQDIYALALNLLPARYTQQFSIVLDDPVDDWQIRKALCNAVEKVRDNPTGPDREFEGR